MTSNEAAHSECPYCGSRTVGRIGTRQYFCWDCCIEYTLRRDGELELFAVQLDGTLEALEALEGREELTGE